MRAWSFFAWFQLFDRSGEIDAVVVLQRAELIDPLLELDDRPLEVQHHVHRAPPNGPV